MCAVSGTKLYGLRIKKKSQIMNNCNENIFKKIIPNLKNLNYIDFGTFLFMEVP